MDQEAYKIRIQKIDEQISKLRKREEDVTCSDELLDFEKTILAEIRQKINYLQDEKEILLNYKEF